MSLELYFAKSMGSCFSRSPAPRQVDAMHSSEYIAALAEAKRRGMTEWVVFLESDVARTLDKLAML
jgi:hypothetical protein